MTSAVVELDHAELSFDGRRVWGDLDLTVPEGQFLTVLGPNGSGKSSLLKVLLGINRLHSGSAHLFGAPIHRGDKRIGYIPQQRHFSRDIPIRGRDLVQLGLDGTRLGSPTWRRSKKVEELLRAVGASDFAEAPMGLLSGGQQQRLRVAHALAGDPELLLCDEPLLSLDIPGQHHVVDLLAERVHHHGGSVVFVTHEINPVLPVTDRVLYLAAGRHRLGSPNEVMNSETLTQLYDTPIEVINHRGAIIIVGGEHTPPVHEHHHLEEPA